MNEWAVSWQMEFSISKCSVMNLSRKNQLSRYTFRNVTLKESDTEKNVGMVISTDLVLENNLWKLEIWQIEFWDSLSGI